MTDELNRFRTSDPQLISGGKRPPVTVMLGGLLLFSFGLWLGTATLLSLKGEVLAALAASVVCASLGGAMMLGNGWAIDLGTGTVSTWFSILGIRIRKVRPLSSFGEVIIKTKGQFVAICVSGEGTADVELHAYTSTTMAEHAAGQIAAFAGLECAYTEEAFEEAVEESLQEEVAELPANSKLSFTTDGDTVTVTQAPSGYGPAQIVVVILVVLFFVGLVVGLFALQLADGGGMNDISIGCTGVFSLIPLGIGALALLKVHAEVGRPVKIELSPEKLRVEFPAMIGKSVQEVETRNVDDTGFADLKSDWSRSGGTVSREASPGGHVIIRRAKGVDIHLGRGLSVDEQVWLRATIEKMVTLR